MQVARLFLSRSLHQASAELAPRSDSFGKGSKQILPRLPVDSFTVHRKRMSTQAKDQSVGESVTSGVAVQAQAVDCGQQPKEPGPVHLARQASSSNACSAARPSNEGPEPGL